MSATAARRASWGVRVFTDGACSGNPGPGGWAWVTEDDQHASGAEPESTNQRMELTAVLRAIEDLPGELAIHSDSTYVVNCFNDRWYESWLARDWKNSQKKPVANRDLWEPLIGLYLARRDEITFTWVKGHSGNELNERADQLAVAEVELLRAVMANEAASLGDEPEPPWPVDQAIVVTGIKELDDDQLEGLESAIATLDRDNDVVISGLRLGTELVAAESAVRAGVPVGVVLPYADPVRVWSPADRERFDTALGKAEWVITLDGDPTKPGPSITRRNHWLWASAVGAIVVGDSETAADAEAAGLGVIVVE